jgi:hypothetical protein
MAGLLNTSYRLVSIQLAGVTPSIRASGRSAQGAGSLGIAHNTRPSFTADPELLPR